MAFYWLFKIEKNLNNVNETSISVQLDEKYKKHYGWELINVGKFKVSAQVMSHNHNYLKTVTSSVCVYTHTQYSKIKYYFLLYICVLNHNAVLPF